MSVATEKSEIQCPVGFQFKVKTTFFPTLPGPVLLIPYLLSGIDLSIPFSTKLPHFSPFDFSLLSLSHLMDSYQITLYQLHICCIKVKNWFST